MASWLRPSAPDKRGAAVDAGCQDAASSPPWTRQPKRRLVRRRTPLGEAPPELTAEHLLRGQVLDVYAQHATYAGVMQMGRPSLKGDLKIVSLCSGSEMLSVAMDALSKELLKQQIHIDIRVPCICEVDETKRRWCMAVQEQLHPQDSQNMCAFTDVTSFIDGEGFCERHGKTCVLPDHLDGVVAGTSCKDFSRANPNRRRLSGDAILATGSSPGKSADTLRGTFSVIDKRTPEFVILENVDTLDEADHAAGLDFVLQELGARGYDTQAFLVDSSEYGLPQARKRVFVLAVLSPGRKFRVKNYSRFFERVTDVLLACKLRGPGLLHVLLQDDDEFVAEELEQRQKCGPKGWDSSTIETHRREWSRVGLRWQACQPKASDKRSAWYERLNARQRDVLAYTQHTARGSQRERTVKTLGVDVGQSIGRAPTTAEHHGKICSPTILPGSIFWLSADPGDLCDDAPPGFIGIHRPLLGVESMMLQGWPVFRPCWRGLVDAHTDTVRQSLAGNAFAGTVIVSLMSSLLFALDWTDDAPADWSKEIYTDGEASTAAMSLLQSSS